MKILLNHLSNRRYRTKWRIRTWVLVVEEECWKWILSPSAAPRVLEVHIEQVERGPERRIARVDKRAGIWMDVVVTSTTSQTRLPILGETVGKSKTRSDIA